jgi:hypothetical protein
LGFYLAILRLPVWGRPVVGGVEVLCMLTVQVVAAGVEKKEYNGG